MLMRTFLLAAGLAAGLAAIAAPVQGQPTPLPPIASLKGRVVLPDGKPAVDAPVVVALSQEVVARTRTDVKGEFSFAKAGEKDAVVHNEIGWRNASLAAGAKGFGPAWRMLRTITATEPLVLSLVEDQPVVGRILDQQGNPVPNAEISEVYLYAQPNGVEGFLRKNRDNPYELMLYLSSRAEAMKLSTVQHLQGSRDPGRFVRSDSQGRVALSGFGKDRVLACIVSGPKILREMLYIVTIPQIDSKWNRRPPSTTARHFMEAGMPLFAVFPATFHLIARPARTVAGRVVEAASGRPVAGMFVSAGVRGVIMGDQAATDADGRYSVGGVPLEGELRVSVLNPGGKPYLDAVRTTALTVERPDVSMDFRLARGVVASGRVRDENGKPVRGYVSYFSWPKNPALTALPEPFGAQNQFQTDVEGRFSIVIPPGPGVLAFGAMEDRYAKAKDADFGFPLYANGARRMFEPGNSGLIFAWMYNAIRRVEPATGAEKYEVDFALRSTRTLTIRVVGSDGKPIAERVSVNGATEALLHSGPIESTFPVSGLQPGRSRTILISDERKQSALVAKVTCPSDGGSSPIVLRLQPTGEVSGRLLDAEGRPCSKWYVTAGSSGIGEANLESEKPPHRVFPFGNGTCDVDGYFRIVGIPSRNDFDLLAVPADGRGAYPVATGLSVQPRERHDTGVLTLKSGK